MKLRARALLLIEGVDTLRSSALFVVGLLGITSCVVREDAYQPPVAPEAAPVAPLAAERDEDVDDPNADTDPRALSTFEPILSPYGSWAEDDEFGLVWIPNPVLVGADFSPYLTAGHWAYTREGYYWESDYPWGWATFHYGRWVWTPRGWAWIAGARYAPSWVDWRYGDSYIGWGPRRPHWIWRGGAAVSVSAGPTPFVFAPSDRFFHPHPHQVIVAPAAVPSAAGATKPWAPAPPPTKGARPFLGPDPKIVGIPAPQVEKATIAPPATIKPNAVPWHAAPKLAPAPAAPSAVGPAVGAPAPKPAPPIPPAVTTPTPVPHPPIAPAPKPAPIPPIAPAPKPAPPILLAPPAPPKPKPPLPTPAKPKPK